jgi:hypothetical protein
VLVGVRLIFIYIFEVLQNTKIADLNESFDTFINTVKMQNEMHFASTFKHSNAVLFLPFLLYTIVSLGIHCESLKLGRIFTFILNKPRI